MREFKIQETMVELLTKQYEMARLSESKDLSPFQVLQKAKIPERKSKSARAKKVIMATFLAFFFSLLLAFVMENFSRMPKENRERLKSLRAGLPFLRNTEFAERKGLVKMVYSAIKWCLYPYGYQEVLSCVV